MTTTDAVLKNENPELETSVQDLAQAIIGYGTQAICLKSIASIMAREIGSPSPHDYDRAYDLLHNLLTESIAVDDLTESQQWALVNEAKATENVTPRAYHAGLLLRKKGWL